MNNINKSTALRITAKAIRDGVVHYNWFRHESCNCGVLAQTIIGKSALALRNSIQPMLSEAALLLMKKSSDGSPTWTEMSRVFCPVTGLPENMIFSALADVGFTTTDLRNIEYLRDPSVLARAGIKKNPVVMEEVTTGMLWWKKTETKQVEDKNPHYTIPKSVAAYMDAWADMLDEEAATNPDTQLQMEAERIKSEASKSIAAK